MKTRKNIRDVFKHDGKESELESGEVVFDEITTFPGDINDFYVYYAFHGDKKISFTYGEELIPV
jgi:hypothetical protein